MKRGKFVVLCGIDGCGKSSVIENLFLDKDNAEAYSKMKHPPKEWYENSKIRAAYLDGEGEKIQDEEELEITYKLRKNEEKRIIVPQLLSGENIIFHRYIFSLYAYYLGIGKFSLRSLTEYYGDILLPDKVIYLKISIDEFYRRFQSKEQLSYQKDPEYVKRAMECYEELTDMYGWNVIDTESQTLEKSVEDICSIVNSIEVDDGFYDLKKRAYVC